MAIIYVATIDAADYEAVRRLLPTDMPPSHDKWEFLRLARKAKVEGSGSTVLDYRIDPAAFLRQCDSNHSYLSLHGLWRFAEEQGLQSSRHRS